MLGRKVGEMAQSKIDNGDAGSSGEASLNSELAVGCGGGGKRKGLTGDVGVAGEYGKRGELDDAGECVEVTGSGDPGAGKRCCTAGKFAVSP